jgi:hypothetical protein
MDTYNSLIVAINSAGTLPPGLHPISKNTQFLKTEDGHVGVILFKTLIALWHSVDPPWLILHHGGWTTKTTSQRLNTLVYKLTDGKAHFHGYWRIWDTNYRALVTANNVQSSAPISIDLHKITGDEESMITALTPEQTTLYYSIEINPKHCLP